MDILQASVGFWRTHWSATKFTELISQYSFSRIRDLFHVGITTSYESNVFHRMRVNPPKNLSLLPHQEAIVKILAHDVYDDRLEIELLGDRFYGLSTLKVPEDKSFWYFRLQDLGDCHPSWVVYKSAAMFLQKPSKDTLAQALRTVAPLMNSEPISPRRWWQSQIPWPLAACINLCDTEEDALDMARRADAGQLGDVDSWQRAEHRWRTAGVTERDIRSMSDERLPFDREIDSLGFPIALSIWPAFRPYTEDVGSLKTLLDLYSEMKSCKARRLVASLVEMCFVGASMFIAPDESEYPIKLDLERLQSVFEDLPIGRSVPLHAIVNILSGSDQEIVDFFRAANARQVDFNVYDVRGLFHKDGLDRLTRAFVTSADNGFLVPMFGALAENGQLPSTFVQAENPKVFNIAEQEMASLVIMLAQESWTTDRDELAYWSCGGGRGAQVAE